MRLVASEVAVGNGKDRELKDTHGRGQRSLSQSVASFNSKQFTMRISPLTVSRINRRQKPPKDLSKRRPSQVACSQGARHERRDSFNISISNTALKHCQNASICSAARSLDIAADTTSDGRSAGQVGGVLQDQACKQGTI